MFAFVGYLMPNNANAEHMPRKEGKNRPDHKKVETCWLFGWEKQAENVEKNIFCRKNCFKRIMVIFYKLNHLDS